MTLHKSGQDPGLRLDFWPPMARSLRHVQRNLFGTVDGRALTSVPIDKQEKRGTHDSMSQQQGADVDLLDANGLAERLKCSAATIGRLTRTGRIPFVKVGKLIRYDVAAVIRSLTREPSGPTEQD